MDANILVVAATGDPRRGVARRALQSWTDAGEALHAPALLPYEFANSLTRLVEADKLPAERVGPVWLSVLGLPVTYHSLERVPRVVEIAGQLQRRSAYDAAYLALAEELQAVLWTFDGPLARNATQSGFTVRLLEGAE
ncbi:MAG: type II toxin-antitoxin system VapC family toxin [Candidatus Dormibacteraeota bacterium]|nr:type II toxin-antitoxin system VapC family toxin [Candidatus Dormibacteraeota bacterium]